MTTPTTTTISSRALARQLAAQKGIALDAAQLLIAATAKAVRSRQAATDAIEPVARQVADARRIPLDQARAAAERLLSETAPPTPTDRGRELVVPFRARAKALAMSRGIALEVAQRLLEEKPRRAAR